MSDDHAIVQARLVTPHQDLGPDDTYHEWVFPTHSSMKANKLGVSNPRMCEAGWRKICCNNGGCAAWGLVNEQAMFALLDAQPLLPITDAQAYADAQVWQQEQTAHLVSDLANRDAQIVALKRALARAVPEGLCEEAYEDIDDTLTLAELSGER